MNVQVKVGEECLVDIFVKLYGERCMQDFLSNSALLFIYLLQVAALHF